MPLDPSIPLAGRPPDLNPMAAFATGQGIRLRQEEAAAINAQRRSAAAENDAQTKAIQRQAEEDAVLMQVFTTKPLKDIKPSDIYSAVNPKRAGEIWKGIVDGRREGFKDEQEVRTSMLTRLTAIKNLPEQARAGAWDAALQDYAKHGVIDPAKVGAYSPELMEQFEYELLSPEQREKRAAPQYQTVNGQIVQMPKKDGEQVTPVYTAPETPAQKAAREAQEKRDAEAARHNRATEAISRTSAARSTEPLEAVVDPVTRQSVLRPRSQAVGMQPATSRERPTEDERKSVGFYGQMRDAISTLDELEDKLSEAELYQIQTLPQEGLVGLANRGQLSEGAKRYIRAFEQFTEARLRPVSGAAIADSEYARDRRTYAKQFSETPALNADRRRARDIALDSLRKRAGVLAPEAENKTDTVKVKRIEYDMNGNEIKKD